MSTLKVSTIAPLGTDATKTITIGDLTNGDVAAGVFTNVPAFNVDKTSDQSISDGTWTKVTFTNEHLDTDSAFSDSKFTVPTGKGGKYFFSTMIRGEGTNGTVDYFSMAFYKNGSRMIIVNQLQTADNQLKNSHIFGSAMLTLSASDYIEVYANFSGSSLVVAGDSSRDISSFFTGFRVIGA